MMKTRIVHVFFDLDHTLWDFDKNSALAFKIIFQNLDIDVSLESFLQVYQPINMHYWKLFREEEISKEALRRGRLVDTFAQLNLSYPLSIIDALADHYIKALPLSNHLISGAEDTLIYLSKKYNLHIITNGFKEVQEQKLKASGIAHYFKTVTNSDEVGVKKPNRIIFDTALRSARAQFDNSIMIGDNYEADILGAQNIGLQAICFNYHNQKIPTNIIQITDLKEIIKIL
ncbi:YjjG family noncanonical pyrimidine nucleotidase [Aquimarina sp. W85]|uniref:YjjG family noncanonical pyrimidine nucleotidase n=1 Tax=Aquimarina rhodophyticola TaxID=3342246 RepID=UPI00366D7A3E